MADDIMTVNQMLRFRWETEPDLKAFSFVNKNGPFMKVTAEEIYLSGGKFAAQLRKYGFKTGDIIANGIPNSPERLITDMGIIMAGCVVVNCQVVEKDGSNFFNVARISKACGVIVPNRQDNVAYTLLSPLFTTNPTKSSVQCLGISIPEVSTLNKAIVVDRVENDSDNSLLDSLRSSSVDIFNSDPAPTDLAVLFATSGSTGFSKLVPFSHETIFKMARTFPAIKDIISFTDRPMGWVGGFPFDFLAHGSRRFVQDMFDNLQAKKAADLWNVIAGTKCQGAALLPGAIYELVDLFKENPPEFKLGFITTGGQAMRQRLAKALGLLCSAIVVSYGNTEGGISFFNVYTEPSQIKDFQCGKATKDVEFKIVDEMGNELPTDQEGNLLIKCERILSNYYNVEAQPDPSEFFTPDGYYKTGDRAKVDVEGFLYCYGRSGDVVSLGSVIIYLSWPEDILSKCPLLLNSCVIGIQEENGNAFLCACVIPCHGVEITESQVIDFFEQAVVDAGRYEAMPKMSRVFVMDSFPLLPSGKVNKPALQRFVRNQLNP